jgi:tellurite resistance protein
MSLRKEGFLAVVAVARADGLLRADEARGVLGAAKEAGLSEAELAEVQAALDSGLELETLNLERLSGPERALTYGFAIWLAKVDGIVNSDELATLRRLGGLLDLPEPKLKAAASAAFDITCLPGGNRPEKFEFSKLEARLREKLPALMADRDAQK